MNIRAVTSLLLALASFGATAAGETWPKYNPKPAEVAELNERYAGTSGRYHDTSYQSYMQDYAAFGDYLNWGKWRRFVNDGEIVIHKSGLPQVQDGDQVYWNTVALSHYALTMYGRQIRGDKSAAKPFLAAVDKLLELQRPDGGFPYPSRQHRHTTLKDGWVSAMAQGNALSVFARALQVKDDSRYRKAGELAMKNLLTPVSKGGSFTTMADLNPSLASYVFFPEYPNTPIDYTLNGYMFALLGIYDWSKVKSTNQAHAAKAFRDGMTTLDKILPLYDVDGFSAYDLAHIVLKLPPYVAPDYLGIHVYLLHALNSVAPSKVMAKYEREWKDKVDAMNKSLKFTTIKTSAPTPQAAAKPVTITLDSAGGTGAKKLYKVSVRHNGTWSTLTDYSEKSTFVWTPKEPGEYVLGFFVKNADSKQEWDNFRNMPFVIR